MLEINQISNGDCLELMKDIPDDSVDAIITDLPYGTTACKWDSVIPFEPLWEQYKRMIKPTGAIVLFSQQPFTSALIMSNIEMWKYNWIWQKDNGSNFLNAHHQPLKITEDICVFGLAATTESKRGVYLNYNPQMRQGYKPYKCVSGAQREDTAMVRGVCKAQDGNVRGMVRFFRCDEDYDKIKKVLALAFMNFLDANRPEGKMCLSNGECANIDDAFATGNWDMLSRYIEKYLKKGE